MKPPHDQTKPMTFYPSLEELSSFEKYVAYMESLGAHKAGVAKIVPPKNWVARKVGYDLTEMDIRIKTQVEQSLSKTKVVGAFITQTEQSTPYSTLPQFHRLATSLKHLPPQHSSPEELEQLYWKQVTEDRPPLQATLTDPDQAVLNLANLPSILLGKH